MRRRSTTTPSRPRRRAPARPLAVAALATLLIAATGLTPGCGGSGGTQPLPGGGSPVAATMQGAGRAVFSVRWPERVGSSRLVPVAAESIKIAVKRGESIVAERVLPRPAQGDVSEAAFENLPLGDLIATATAYPNPDATGVAQATATMPVTVAAGHNTPLRLTMGTTIARLDVPAEVTLKQGTGTQLPLTARNSTGEVVLTAAETLTWKSSHPEVVAVISSTGGIEAGKPGTSTITVTESESGKQATCVVAVTRNSPFEMTILEPLGSYSSFTDPGGINEYGQVVGGAVISSGASTSYLWQPDQPNGTNGRMFDLGRVPGATIGGALEISDDGKVILNYIVDGAQRAFLWTPGQPNGSTGTLISIGVLPGAHGILAHDINNRGAIVGYAGKIDSLPSSTIKAFWYENGQMVELPGMGHRQTAGLAINNLGWIGGNGHSPASFPDAEDSKALLWKPGSSGYSLSSLGDGNVQDLNDDGIAVGQYEGSAVAWRNGQRLTLPVLGSSLWGMANAINRYGRIVGKVRADDGRSHAVLWMPSAEGIGGSVIDLNTLIPEGKDVFLGDAVGINDGGQVLCNGRVGTSPSIRSILLTPQPGGGYD